MALGYNRCPRCTERVATRPPATTDDWSKKCACGWPLHEEGLPSGFKRMLALLERFQSKVTTRL